MKLKKINEKELTKMRKYANVYRDLLAEKGDLVADGSPYGFCISDEEYDESFTSAKEFLATLDFEYVTHLVYEALSKDKNFDLIDEYMSDRIYTSEKSIKSDYSLDMLPARYSTEVINKRMAALNACTK